MKTLQKFSPEYLELCKTMSPAQKIKFLEEFRLIHGRSHVKEKSRLISIKIPQDLLDTFRTKCQFQNIPYQTQIKILMREWLGTSRSYR